ncbi:MAG: HEPN domain-containing protein [Acidimicrobiia bacterium]
MPSQSQIDLLARLHDVDELIEAHIALTGGGAGRPARRQGAAVTRAGVVLLAAATEAFVEDLFEEAAPLLWPSAPKSQLKMLFDNTSKRLNNADVRKTQLLFFNLGLPGALDEVRWRKFSNASFKESLDSLVTTRNKIAHGLQPSLRLGQLRYWRRMVGHYAERLDSVVADHIQSLRGKRPPW